MSTKILNNSILAISAILVIGATNGCTNQERVILGTVAGGAPGALLTGTGNRNYYNSGYYSNGYYDSGHHYHNYGYRNPSYGYSSQRYGRSYSGSSRPDWSTPEAHGY